MFTTVMHDAQEFSMVSEIEGYPRGLSVHAHVEFKHDADEGVMLRELQVWLNDECDTAWDAVWEALKQEGIETRAACFLPGTSNNPHSLEFHQHLLRAHTETMEAVKYATDTVAANMLADFAQSGKVAA